MDLILFRKVCEGWRTSRSFFGIHVQLCYINTNIRIWTIACNNLRCSFIGSTLWIHLILFRWVCEGWRTSRSFFGIHAQLFYINTNIRVRTTACNHLRCPFMGTTLQVHLILFRKACEGWRTSRSFLHIHAQLWLDTFIKKECTKKVMGQTWDKMNGS